MSRMYEIKWGLGLVLVGLLTVSMMVGPTLWAAPGQRPEMQTLPSRTPTPDAPEDPTPTSGPPPATDEPPPPPPPATDEPPSSPPPAEATATPATPATDPTATPTPTSAPEETVMPGETVTPTPTPQATVAATDVATDVATDASGAPGTSVETEGTAGAPSVTPGGEENLTEELEVDPAASPQSTAEPGGSSASATAEAGEGVAPTAALTIASEPALPDGAAVANLTLCGGAGLVLLGVLLLVVWRFRG